MRNRPARSRIFPHVTEETTRKNQLAKTQRKGSARNMIDLTEVVSAINARHLRLVRTADTIKVEGDCPPNLAAAIQQHADALLPFAAIDPEHREAIAKQTAAAAADAIRDQMEAFGEWIAEHHLWAVGGYAQQWLDGRLTVLVDRQQPSEVAAEIVRLKAELAGIDWATLCFPVAMETEAKHATANGAFTAVPPKADDVPF
ncbi:MAG: hypothetical protein NXI04_01595 [Planctomycetaceae bacterium]|nr:hypothetical protein [Planctomycetaceae bacterium]